LAVEQARWIDVMKAMKKIWATAGTAD